MILLNDTSVTTLDPSIEEAIKIFTPLYMHVIMVTVFIAVVMLLVSMHKIRIRIIS